LHGVLFRVKPSAVDRSSGESLLAGGKLYVHSLQNTETGAMRQPFGEVLNTRYGAAQRNLNCHALVQLG
jgi:hypothetical protein